MKTPQSVIIFMFFALMITVPGNLSATNIKDPITPLKALNLIYGNLTQYNGVFAEPAIWIGLDPPKGMEIHDSYSNKQKGYVYVVYEKYYEEDGERKYLLITQTRPNTDYFCNACIPLLGGFIFKFSENIWILESKNEYMTRLGDWGWCYRSIKFNSDGTIKENLEDNVKISSIQNSKTFSFSAADNHYTFDLIPISDKKFAVFIGNRGGTHGTEDVSFNIFVPNGNYLKNALHARVESPIGICGIDTSKSKKQDIIIVLKKTGNRIYYDLTVQKKWFDGPCDNLRFLQEKKTYHLSDGSYIEKRF